MGRNRFTKKERAWILYDWANSVYATNIMAAIFPPIFVSFAGDAGDMVWGYATSFATLVAAILSPILGAVADYKGMKKKLFSIFALMGIISTGLIAAFDSWKVMLVFYVISRIGFSCSNLFYDSFLTDVTSNERMDKVSSWGYAMGYIGGSTIPFVISIAVLAKLGYGNPFAQKFSIIITSVWWLVFTIPFLKNVEQVHYIDDNQKPTLSSVLKQTLQTAKEIMMEKGLFLFIIAYFFYIDGVGTVINISTAYGASLGLGAMGMILALLVTQIVAMPCSILFGGFSKKVGARKLLLFAIAVYIVICLFGFVMGFTLEPSQEAYDVAYDGFKAEAIAELPTFVESDKAQAALTVYFQKTKNYIRDNNQEGLEKLHLTWADMHENDAALAIVAEDKIELSRDAFIDTTDSISAYQKSIKLSSTIFWMMAILVGTVQGGIQATSRSLYGKLIPKKRSNEFFGFFDIFGKIASFIGPLLYSIIGTLTGRSSYGTIALALLFVIGFIVLYKSGDELDRLEKERAMALD
jgi:UMF1 family MFS transporter